LPKRTIPGDKLRPKWDLIVGGVQKPKEWKTGVGKTSGPTRRREEQTSPSTERWEKYEGGGSVLPEEGQGKKNKAHPGNQSGRSTKSPPASEDHR